MSSRLAILNVVGLSRGILNHPQAARLRAFSETAGISEFQPEFPALTCTAQSSMITGTGVSEHGIVANGWYDREFAEHRFWKQSNAIVRGPKLWEILREARPGFTTANLFWWYNMHSTVDFSATPRPLYLADGRKVFDIHTQPMALRERLKQALGPFPFFSFWGPGAGIECSEWIAESAKWIEDREHPDLNLVYLPHLDYILQKQGPDGPDVPGEVAKIDAVVGGLLDHFHAAGVRVMIVSEYGISKVDRAVSLNREFRKHGWLSIKDEIGTETLDLGGCRAFAIADHQVAHIYVQDPAILDRVREVTAAVQGVEEVKPVSEVWDQGIARQRGGDLIAIASPDAWFTYYYWENDALAPDFARTVDIHRKLGYDPCELFIDPSIRLPKARIAAFLMKKKLGFRSLLDVVPLDPSLVRGSHGRAKVAANDRPVAIGASREIRAAPDIHQAILAAALGDSWTQMRSH